MNLFIFGKEIPGVRPRRMLLFYNWPISHEHNLAALPSDFLGVAGISNRGGLWRSGCCARKEFLPQKKDFWVTGRISVITKFCN